MCVSMASIIILGRRLTFQSLEAESLCGSFRHEYMCVWKKMMRNDGGTVQSATKRMELDDSSEKERDSL